MSNRVFKASLRAKMGVFWPSDQLKAVKPTLSKVNQVAKGASFHVLWRKFYPLLTRPVAVNLS